MPATEEVPATETPAEETPHRRNSSGRNTCRTCNRNVYTIDKVNVRSGADTSADKLGSVEKGTALTRTGTEGDWSIVDYNGTTGYIKSEFLSAASIGRMFLRQRHQKH